MLSCWITWIWHERFKTYLITTVSSFTEKPVLLLSPASYSPLLFTAWSGELSVSLTGETNFFQPWHRTSNVFHVTLSLKKILPLRRLEWTKEIKIITGSCMTNFESKFFAFISKLELNNFLKRGCCGTWHDLIQSLAKGLYSSPLSSLGFPRARSQQQKGKKQRPAKTEGDCRFLPKKKDLQDCS